MRKLIVLLIVFIAVVTFIRTYDKADAGTHDNISRQNSIVEAGIKN